MNSCPLLGATTRTISPLIDHEWRIPFAGKSPKNRISGRINTAKGEINYPSEVFNDYFGAFGGHFGAFNGCAGA
ncbi:MAG TPA: hypothetical protein VIT91_01570 [Chthoniobacterales bacterium]